MNALHYSLEFGQAPTVCKYVGDNNDGVFKTPNGKHILARRVNGNIQTVGNVQGVFAMIPKWYYAKLPRFDPNFAYWDLFLLNRLNVDATGNIPLHYVGTQFPTPAFTKAEFDAACPADKRFSTQGKLQYLFIQGSSPPQFVENWMTFGELDIPGKKGYSLASALQSVYEMAYTGYFGDTYAIPGYPETFLYES